MHTHSDSKQDNKSELDTSSVSQKQRGDEATFQFTDNRPEAIVQRKLKEVVDNAHINTVQKKLEDISNNSLPLQAKSSTNNQVIQLSALYDAIETTAKDPNTPTPWAVTNLEIENATKELIGEMLVAKEYKDSGGTVITPEIINGLLFLFDADYGASAAMITLPSNANIQQDIANNNFKLSMMHEMGHYIRKIGDEGSVQSFADAEAILVDVVKRPDWTTSATAANGNREYWEEEIRADLKGIMLQFNQDGTIPDNSRIEGFGATLGAADAMHPPSNIRIWAMKRLANKLTPSRCYLTTACVQAKGLADDCEELTLLRYFRDSYLLKLSNGTELIKLYYQYSPQIVHKINKAPEKDEIYLYIYDVLSDCVDAIKQNKLEYTYKKYCQMVLMLKEKFLQEDHLPPFQV